MDNIADVNDLHDFQLKIQTQSRQDMKKQMKNFEHEMLSLI